MDAADICSGRKSLMKVNNPTGLEDRETFGTLNEFVIKMMSMQYVEDERGKAPWYNGFD